MNGRLVMADTAPVHCERCSTKLLMAAAMATIGNNAQQACKCLAGEGAFVHCRGRGW